MLHPGSAFGIAKQTFSSSAQQDALTGSTAPALCPTMTPPPRDPHSPALCPTAGPDKVRSTTSASL